MFCLREVLAAMQTQTVNSSGWLNCTKKQSGYPQGKAQDLPEIIHFRRQTMNGAAQNQSIPRRVGMGKLAVFIIGILVMGAIAFLVVNRSIRKKHSENQNKQPEDDK